MDPEPYSWLLLSIFTPSFAFFVGAIIMLFLLIFSALISGSEVAYFALSPQDKLLLEQDTNKTSQLALALLDRPNKLLATILIANNFVNVAIVVVSSFIMESSFNFGNNALLAFFVQLVAVTLLILLLGEIIPKVYANRYSLKLAGIMAYPILFMSKIFSPVSNLLLASTRMISKSNTLREGDRISVDELSHALELTAENETTEEEQKILKGIVNFGNIDAKQIMKPRTDVIAFASDTSYQELLDGILQSGYSRIPIFEESLDKVSGILYIKDLLPHLSKKDFKWNDLLRQPFFVPENKKIDDLLKEFQGMKMHQAIVVDEYGGTSGLVTLEDVIEEIVGEISDEFDDDDLIYSKLDANNYVFEGKAPLVDIYRIMGVDGELWENVKGESDTLAGLILELSGKIPKKNERIQFEQYTFTIEAADKRRIKRVKITVSEQYDEDEK